MNDECMKSYACMLPRDLMYIVCSFISRYFPFYDEYGRIYYDNDDDYHA